MNKKTLNKKLQIVSRLIERQAKLNERYQQLIEDAFSNIYHSIEIDNNKLVSLTNAAKYEMVVRRAINESGPDPDSESED